MRALRASTRSDGASEAQKAQLGVSNGGGGGGSSKDRAGDRGPVGSPSSRSTRRVQGSQTLLQGKDVYGPLGARSHPWALCPRDTPPLSSQHTLPQQATQKSRDGQRDHWMLGPWGPSPVPHIPNEPPCTQPQRRRLWGIPKAKITRSSELSQNPAPSCAGEKGGSRLPEGGGRAWGSAPGNKQGHPGLQLSCLWLPSPALRTATCARESARPARLPGLYHCLQALHPQSHGSHSHRTEDQLSHRAGDPAAVRAEACLSGDRKRLGVPRPLAAEGRGSGVGRRRAPPAPLPPRWWSPGPLPRLDTGHTPLWAASAHFWG